MSQKETCVRLTVQVTPNAHRTEVVAMVDGAFKLRLRAPPVDGKANQALIRFLADALDLPKSAISIVSGHSGRRKVVEIAGDGMSPERVAALLLPVS